VSELQAHHCLTPEQWTWLLCSVSVILANKLRMFGLSSNFKGENARLVPLRTPMLHGLLAFAYNNECPCMVLRCCSLVSSIHCTAVVPERKELLLREDFHEFRGGISTLLSYLFIVSVVRLF